MAEELSALDSMEQDAQEQFTAPSNEDLSQIAALAQQQLDLEKEIAEVEEHLAEKKRKLGLLSEVDIPNLLEKFGMSMFKLIDGSIVDIKVNLVCGITEANKPAAFAWLAETGNDGIIKNEFKLPFGKGQDAEAQDLKEFLDGAGFSYTNSRNVHHSTLKSFVKKRLEAGEEVPVDLFSVFEKKVATVTPPKKK